MQFLENSQNRLTKNRQTLFLTLMATIISFCLAAQPCQSSPVQFTRGLSGVQFHLVACDDPAECECSSESIVEQNNVSPWSINVSKLVSSCSTEAYASAFTISKGCSFVAENTEKKTTLADAYSGGGTACFFNAPKGCTLVVNWHLKSSGVYYARIGIEDTDFVWSNLPIIKTSGMPPTGGAVVPVEPGENAFSVGGSCWTDNPAAARVSRSNVLLEIRDLELLKENEKISTKKYKDYTETVKGKKKKKKKTGAYEGTEAVTDWGYRVKRMKEGVDGWIAGDFYGSSDNAPYLLKNGGFRWLNYSLDADGNPVVADMYTYDPDTDTVEKRQYSSEGIDALKQELEDAANESRDSILPEAPKWTGSPAENPDDLANVPLAGTQSTTVAPQSLANQQGDLQEIKTRSPGAWLELSSRNDNDNREWRYTLNVNSILGAHISPGDRISIESSEIQSGSVEGDAATASKGSWQLVGTETGFLTFEATTHAYLDGSLGEFVAISGTNTQKGEINYTDEGDWIGYADTVEGPIPVGPDLTSMPEGDFLIGPKGKKNGNRVNATLEVWNQGNEDAGEFTVKVFLSDDETLDDTDILKQTLNVEGLATGVSSSLKINIKHTSSMKGKYLIASIDSEAHIEEAREDNNLAVGQIY